MKNSTRNRQIASLILTGLATVPLAGASTASIASAASANASKTQTFKGPVEDVDHGPVQVSIVVKNKKIVDVKVATSPDGGRSQAIQSQALPILRQETLKAQSAKINLVSGATDTSGGYVTSLQAAVSKARKAKALK